MKVYILVEDTIAYLGETSFVVKNHYCRTFATMQAVINAMRLWKPSTFDTPYKIDLDEETNSRLRHILYHYLFDDEDQKSYITMSTDLMIQTTEVE